MGIQKMGKIRPIFIILITNILDYCAYIVHMIYLPGNGQNGKLRRSDTCIGKSYYMEKSDRYGCIK